jgi:DNA-binding transcriptional ArsR family regulator
MVESAVRMDRVFHALSNATRRDLIDELATSERTVGSLASPLPMSVAAVSKHLKVLEEAGLVERRTSGRETVCRLRGEPLGEVERWVRMYERFWHTRLEQLDELLGEDET